MAPQGICTCWRVWGCACLHCQAATHETHRSYATSCSRAASALSQLIASVLPPLKLIVLVIFQPHMCCKLCVLVTLRSRIHCSNCEHHLVLQACRGLTCRFRPQLRAALPRVAARCGFS